MEAVVKKKTTEEMLLSLLKNMDFVVLIRKGPWAYSILGEAPDFFWLSFPTETGSDDVKPWTCSYMMEIFFEDAENFFEHEKEGSISSGLWQEEGVTFAEQMFFAEARYIEGMQIVLLHQITERFASHIGVLRKARTEFLNSRNLSREVEKLKDKARTDPLTKIPNREAFIDFVSTAIADTSSSFPGFSIGLIDIDNFKTINDSYGHLTGDDALALVAKILHNNLRRNDIVARYGGDEFIMCITTSETNMVFHIAEKLRSTVAGQHSPQLPPLTVSIGCTTYRPGESLQDTLQRADLALYDAKKAGRNRVMLR